MIIREYSPEDTGQLVSLIADYRVSLASLKSLVKRPDTDSAKSELQDYLSSRYSIYVATDEDEIAGYLVCRIDDDTVWAESLYVKPTMRRRGIGSSLYSNAETLAKELGNDTVYNWVHPNNMGIISLLKKRGYDVLNLIEIRKEWQGERISTTITVGNNEFKY